MANSVLNSSFKGSQSVTSKAVTTTYTFEDAIQVANCSAVGGAFTVTLPPIAGNEGREVTIRKTDAGGNAITVAASSGNTIQGATTTSITTQWQALTLVNDGNMWMQVGGSSSGSGGGGSGDVTTNTAQEITGAKAFSGNVATATTNLAARLGYHTATGNMGLWLINAAPTVNNAAIMVSGNNTMVQAATNVQLRPNGTTAFQATTTQLTSFLLHQFNGNLSPNASGTLDIGTTTLGFRNLYIDGNASILGLAANGNTQVKVGSNSAVTISALLSIQNAGTEKTYFGSQGEMTMIGTIGTGAAITIPATSKIQMGSGGTLSGNTNVITVSNDLNVLGNISAANFPGGGGGSGDVTTTTAQTITGVKTFTGDISTAPSDIGVRMGYVTSSGNMGLWVTSAAATVNNAALMNRNSGVDLTVSATNAVWIKAAGVDAIRVGNGDITININTIVNANLIPASSFATLGDSTYGWNNLYLATGGGNIVGNTGDGASSVAVTLRSGSAYATTGAKLLSIKNNTTEKAFFDKDGGLTLSGVPSAANALTIPDGTKFTTGTTTLTWSGQFGVFSHYIQVGAGIISPEFVASNAASGVLRGNIADGASAIATVLRSSVAYSTAGSKLVSIQNNTTEKAYFDKDGVLAITGTGAVQAITIPAASNMGSASSNVIFGSGNIQFSTNVTTGNTMTANAFTCANGGSLQLQGNPANNASAVVGYINSSNTLNTIGAKLFSLRNNTTEMAYFDKDGSLVAPRLYSAVGTFNNTGGSTTTFATYSLPANRLVTGRSIRIVADGWFTVNGNAKTVKINFGGTDLTDSRFSASTSFNNVYWRIEAEVTATSTSAQYAFCRGIGTGIDIGNTIVAQSVRSTPAESITGAITINVQGIASGSSDIVCNRFTVDYLG